MRGTAFTLALVAGCGRIHFDGRDDAGDDGALACVVDLSLGHDHSCVVLRDGMVRCWGDNAVGQLGDGTTTLRPTPDVVRMIDGTPLDGVVQISAGVEYTTCALRADRSAWCWGQNTSGQLGDNSMVDRAYPVRASVDDVVEIRTGEQHTCARRGDGTLWCWGLADSGRLAAAGTGPQLTPLQMPLASVTSVLTSYAHTCAQTNETLYCWGYNANGQLGNNDNTSTTIPQTFPINGVRAYASAWRATCVSNGVAYCTGNNMYGELGNGTNTNSLVPVPMRDQVGAAFDRVIALGAGDVHGCALRDDGSVWCWGNNARDQLGRPGPSTINPIQVVLDGAASRLAVGNFHACAAVDGVGIQCWGDNALGALGDGTTVTRTSPVTVPLTCER